MESAEISIKSTGEAILIVFSKENVSKSQRQTDLSVEPTTYIRDDIC